MTTADFIQRFPALARFLTRASATGHCYWLPQDEARWKAAWLEENAPLSTADRERLMRVMHALDALDHRQHLMVLPDVEDRLRAGVAAEILDL